MGKRILTGAVDIGGTKIQVGIVDDQGELLDEKSFPTDCGKRSAAEAMDKIWQILKEQCGRIGIEAGELRGIGISCAGPVDPEKGTIENPYTLGGWAGFPAAEYLSALSGVEARMENDANGALMGEVFLRKLQKRKVLMITFGTGIGAAFWNGRTVHRSGRFHPEMGHVIVSSGGEKCYCGHRGCFESLCSGQALNRRAAKAGYEDFDVLYERAGAGEAQAASLLDEILQDIRNGVWNLNIIFKPDTIILAGGFARRYFGMIRDAIVSDSCGKEDFVELFEILPASRDQNPALAGANMLFEVLES
jgi:glucokinase